MSHSTDWFCKKCLMPRSRPRIVFRDGICNACHWAVEKQEIDWDERRAEFIEIVKSYKRHPAYDCIVPFSGGKDSAAISFRLKREFGLNPLLVCYGQLVWTDVGRRNLHRVADAGFDIRYWRVDQEVSRSLARRFFIERGHPKQHYDAAVNAVPLIQAVESNIPLVIYAEHGETEYGGLVLSEDSRRTRDLAEVLEHQVGDDARNWAVDGLTERDLYPYIYPDIPDIRRVGVTAFYFSYFFPWSIYANAQYAKEKLGFEGVDDEYGNRSDGTFENWDSIDDAIDCADYLLMHVKFGFGRATRMASRLIQNGIMTRVEGLELVKKYDGEYPRRYMPKILDYLGMSREEFDNVLDQHRNPEIWSQDSGVWKLRHPPE